MDARAAAARFLDSPSLSDSTRRAYRFDVREFCDWLGARGVDLDEVDVRTLVEYVSYLGSSRRGGGKLAPATISRQLAAGRGLLKHFLRAARGPDAPLPPPPTRR